MRFYNTKSISDILKGLKQEKTGLLSLLNQQKELYAIWHELPDIRLRKTEVTFKIQDREYIRVICPSPTTLNYIRQRRQMIEQQYGGYMSKNHIKRLEITLK